MTAIYAEKWGQPTFPNRYLFSSEPSARILAHRPYPGKGLHLRAAIERIYFYDTKRDGATIILTSITIPQILQEYRYQGRSMRLATGPGFG